MEPGDLEALVAGPIFVSAKEDASRKDALEPLDEAAVVNAVLWKLKEFE